MAEDQTSIAKTFKVKPKLKSNSQRSTKSTLESKYWRSYKPQAVKTLISSVSSLSFSPAAPHRLAAAHSATVTLFSDDLEPKHSLSSFKDVATSPCFRSDGRLLAAGSLSGSVHVFDVKSRTQLRVLKGHGGRPLHVARYPRGDDKLHVFSGGDDAVVRYGKII